jgi:hypothetical protein
MSLITSLLRSGVALVAILCLAFTYSACSSSQPAMEDASISQADHTDPLTPKGTTASKPLRFSSGPFEGQPMPTYIKGSYTLANISNFYDIPLNTLAEAFMVPLERAETIKSGDLKTLYQELLNMGKELGNSSVVMFVSLYKGMPYEPHEPTFLLEPGVQILESAGMLDLLSAQELQYVREHTIPLDEITNVHWDTISNEPQDYDEKSPPLINAKTTFQQLKDAGIPEEVILKVIGATTMPALDLVVRDYCVLNKIQFSYVREELVLYFNQ